MKLTLLATAALVISLCPASLAKAENIEHTRQLLATRQCSNCDLQRAGLVMLDLSQANLKGANLQGANLSRVNLSGADLSGADLTGAGLYGANLTGANLTNANLTGADLREAYFTNANLSGVKLEQANLQGAIGLPKTLGKAEEFFQWGMAAFQENQFDRAIQNYSQAIAMKPDYADAYMARGLSSLRMGDEAVAIADIKRSGELFSQQGNAQGAKTAEQVITNYNTAKAAVLKQQKQQQGNGVGISILSTLGTLAGSVVPLALRFLLGI